MEHLRHHNAYQIIAFEWPPRGKSHAWAWPVLVPHVGGHLYVEDIVLRINSAQLSATLRIRFSFQDLSYREEQVVALEALAHVMATELGARYSGPDGVRQGVYSLTLGLPEEESDQVDIWGMKLWRSLWFACGHTEPERMPIPRLIGEWWQDLVIDGTERPVDRGELLYRWLCAPAHA